MIAVRITVAAGPYNVGDVVELDDRRAYGLVHTGYATLVDPRQRREVAMPTRGAGTLGRPDGKRKERR